MKQLKKKYKIKKTPDREYLKQSPERANIKIANVLQESSPYIEDEQPSMFQIESGDDSSSIREIDQTASREIE